MSHVHSDFGHHIPAPLHQGFVEIKDKIDKILFRMERDSHYTPQRTEIEKFSSQALALIKKYRPVGTKEHKNLLTALIDLTEIPVMHPTMQRIAFKVALKEASKNIQEFLRDCL